MIALAAALGLALACTGPPRPDVLLVTLDTTRADRLGCYGHQLAETDTLDGLAARGVRFARAVSSAPLTIPSHSTIHTGRYPPTHGVRDNGDYILSDDEVTLAERFADAGWQTLAVTAALPTQARWGFGQGFDQYHDQLDDLPTRLDWSDERTADQVVDDALETLATLDEDRPVFAWVHLFDPHWPYEPPEPFKRRHADPYDGEIAFADSQLGRLLDAWEARSEASVVLVTADHGEGLGDGGERTHGFLLHDGTMRVPLVVATRGVAEGFEGGGVVHDPVSHVDIAPTLLRLAGLAPHHGLQGRDLAEGGSDFVFSEATTGWLSLGLAQLRAWTGPEGRYTEGGWGAFYPAVGDQVHVEGEQPTAEQRQRLAELESTLGDRRAPSAAMDPETYEALAALGYMGGAVTDQGDIDPRDVIDVIPLTWVARQHMATGRLPAAEAALERLRARLPDTYGVRRLDAQLLRARGDLATAYEAFAALYLDHPSSTDALQLARLAEQSGIIDEAEGWYREALLLQPTSAEAMGGVVRGAVALGEPERAEHLADRYLRTYPDHAELRLARAALRLASGQLEAAAEDAELALADLHRNPLAWRIAAECQWALGRPDPAIERLQQALRLDPWALELRLAVAERLLEVGRNAEAVRVVEPAARALPDDLELAALEGRALKALEDELGGG